jgi:hypothetical protein
LLLSTFSKDTDDKYTIVCLGMQYRKASFLGIFQWIASVAEGSVPFDRFCSFRFLKHNK